MAESMLGRRKTWLQGLPTIMPVGSPPLGMDAHGCYTNAPHAKHAVELVGWRGNSRRPAEGVRNGYAYDTKYYL